MNRWQLSCDCLQRLRLHVHLRKLLGLMLDLKMAPIDRFFSHLLDVGLHEEDTSCALVEGTGHGAVGDAHGIHVSIAVQYGV